MFIIKLLCQHVSDVIMPIIRRTRLCAIAYSVLHCNKGGLRSESHSAFVWSNEL